MPIQHWGVPLGNLNSQRAYPLTEAASKQDVSGDFTLPDDLILDIEFPVAADTDAEPEKFHLYKLDVFAPGFRVVIAYDDGGTPVIAASATINTASHEEYDSYALVGTGDFEQSVGQIQIGKTTGLAALPAGSYVFDLDGGNLEVAAIKPVIDYVSSIRAINGADTSAKLIGDIEIVAGDNVELTVDTSGDIPVIRIDAVGGDFSEDCECFEEEAPCIKTINGVGPDNNGNFTLLGDACVSISAITNGLQLEDNCSSSCCGCVELEALTAEMEVFGSAAATTRGFVNRLLSEVQQMSSAVLGSILGDEGCPDPTCP